MIKKKIGYFFTNTLFLGLACLALNACASKLAEDHPQGVWLGKLEIDQGTCPTDRLAALRVDKKMILFSPDDGALILRGVFNKKEKPVHLVATLNRIDMDHKPYDLVFEGKAQNENIIGTYGTPDCRAHITFYRPKHYGLSDAIAH